MADETGISLDELRLAARNHGMPLEALRYDLTPAGLHYLLVHYDIPAVDPSGWRLTVDGLVDRPATFTLDQLRSRPAATRIATLECAGNGRALLDPRPLSQPWLYEAVGNAAWAGVRLSDLLAEVGVGRQADEVLFTGLDRGIEDDIEQVYQRSLPLEEAMKGDAVLAYDMNRAALAPQHGFPLRLVVPGWYGMAHVKWLDRVTVITGPFEGYQQRQAYTLRRDPDDPGQPVTRIQPRSLMIPPGIPEFFHRSRRLPPGPVILAGRAWSGFGRVVRVEVSTDGGARWEEADLGPAPAPYAWHAWGFEWTAFEGVHVLCSRATDETGRSQPVEPEWNLGGYEVNAVQRVVVEVGAQPG